MIDASLLFKLGDSENFGSAKTTSIPLFLQGATQSSLSFASLVLLRPPITMSESLSPMAVDEKDESHPEVPGWSILSATNTAPSNPTDILSISSSGFASNRLGQPASWAYTNNPQPPPKPAVQQFQGQTLRPQPTRSAVVCNDSASSGARPRQPATQIQHPQAWESTRAPAPAFDSQQMTCSCSSSGSPGKLKAKLLVDQGGRQRSASVGSSRYAPTYSGPAQGHSSSPAPENRAPAFYARPSNMASHRQATTTVRQSNTAPAKPIVTTSRYALTTQIVKCEVSRAYLLNASDRWEEQNTICFTVEVGGIPVSRRAGMYLFALSLRSDRQLSQTT